MQSLRPAQARYCPLMVAAKEILLEGNLYRGGSLLKVIAVVGDNEPFYSLLDHHHHVLKSLQEGATHVETWVEAIWDEAIYYKTFSQNREEFSTNLTFYYWTLKGQWQDPFPSMQTLPEYGEVDSLRDFLGKTKKYTFYEGEDYIKTYHPEEQKSPFLWKKSWGDVPPNGNKSPYFAEFILADALRACGISENPTRDEAHALLTEARLHPPFQFPFTGWKNFHLDWLELEK
mgnify:CR=1 FL=1